MRGLYLFIMFILAGCAAPAAPAALELPAATMPGIRIPQLVAATATRDLRPVATEPPTQTPPPPLYRCGAAPDPFPVFYEIVANVNYAAKVVDASQTVHFRNRTDEVLTDLVLAVEPNSAPGQFEMGQVLFNNVPLNVVLAANRLWIPLPAALAPGCEVTLNMTFRVHVPRLGMTRMPFQGYLGYSERQINLGNWNPVVAPRINGHWIVNDTAAIGEQLVSDQARWLVTLNVLEGPPGMVAAIPGDVTQLAPSQWRSAFAGGRDFTISLSPDFRVLRQRAIGGTEVEMYAFPDAIRNVNGVLVDGAQHALTEGVRAFEQFESLFGRYMHQRLLIVQGDFPDGMEFSGLVFVSTTWFQRFTGGVRNYLTIITVHEVAHQWWYAQVGNNAALVPWLDEALSTYSEYIYYEEFFPEERSWWWASRVAHHNPQGPVDSTVYEFATVREYINAVYLRGVQMLHRLREDIGTEAFFDLLAEYADRANGRIATAETFWELLSPEQWRLTAQTRAQFLRNPELGGP